MYSIVGESTLLPVEQAIAAKYEPVGVRTLDRPSTIDDICDFVVEYINSDVLVSVSLTCTLLGLCKYALFLRVCYPIDTW